MQQQYYPNISLAYSAKSAASRDHDSKGLAAGREAALNVTIRSGAVRLPLTRVIPKAQTLAPSLSLATGRDAALNVTTRSGAVHLALSLPLTWP